MTDQERSEKLRDVATLRRTAKEVKKHVLLTRVISLLVVILIGLISIAYAVAYFYDKFGSFTVRVNKYDMVNQGLMLGVWYECLRD